MRVEGWLQRPPSAFMLGLLACLPMGMVGTLLHEGGHVLVARALGHGTTLHYGWMSSDGPATDDLAVVGGGPAANMLVGTVGLGILLWRRGHTRRAADVLAWTMALCWSRQLFNLFVGMGMGEGDEPRIAALLGWPAPSVAVGTALPALVACVAACVLLGRRNTLPLTAGGALGSLAGAAAWYGWLGPLLLP